MNDLPERGPVILWTGPDEHRLIAELFQVDGGLVVVRAHWPEADSIHAAHFVPEQIIRQEYDGRGPWYLWPMEDDDQPELLQAWQSWIDRRDAQGATREDARQYAERCLGITTTE